MRIRRRLHSIELSWMCKQYFLENIREPLVLKKNLISQHFKHTTSYNSNFVTNKSPLEIRYINFCVTRWKIKRLLTRDDIVQTKCVSIYKRKHTLKWFIQSIKLKHIELIRSNQKFKKKRKKIVCPFQK